MLYDTNEARFSNVVSIDNRLGLTINSSGETDTEKLLTLKNSFIYGETADLAKDCPDAAGGSTGADCYCKAKMGHMGSVTLKSPKTPHIEMMSSRPVYKCKSYHTWNSKSVLENVNFINFKSENTQCGSTQFAFGVNPTASDG